MITGGSAQELLARASSRHRVEPADARAGAVFERVAVGPESFFVKRLSPSSDWVMRIAGDHVHRPLGSVGELSRWEARVARAAARQHIPIPGGSR